MTRLGWGECLALLAFWLGGLMAYLLGGLVWVGYVAEALLWVSFVWLSRVVYIELRDEVMEEWERSKAFQAWKKQRQMKGME